MRKKVAASTELWRQSRETLGLDGDCSFTIHGVASLTPRQDVAVEVTRKDGSKFSFTALCRIDTANELEYFMNGGILQYVLRKQMTNQSMRERFGLSEGSSNSVSQIITATIDQGLIKSDPNAPDSRRYARYIPAWA